MKRNWLLRRRNGKRSHVTESGAWSYVAKYRPYPDEVIKKAKRNKEEWVQVTLRSQIKFLGDGNKGVALCG